MGALLESGLVGNIGLKHLKVIKEDTINKWDKLGFLDGLKGHLKENVAQLYENQASHLINEAANASDSGSFETVVFPIVRRVFSKLLANDIVSVQAMNLPIGKLFYFVPKIQNRNSDGTHVAPFGAPNGPSTSDSNYDSGKNLYDRFYEGETPNSDPAGLFDYSKGAYTALTDTLVPVKWDAGALVATTLVDVLGAASANVRSLLFALSGFSNAGAGKLIGPDGQEMDNEDFLASLETYFDTTDDVYYNFRVVTQKYGKGIVQYGNEATAAFPGSGPGGKYDNICDVDGIIYLELDLSTPAAIGSASLDGYTGTTVASGATFTASWRRYETLEFEDKIGEVSFDLDAVTVSVTERKLRAQWSPELAQDVSAFHNIDAEAELTALLSEQVAAEIDREILRDLRKGAAWSLRWDYNGWKRVSNGSVNYNQKDWNQTLITAINQISAQIHKSTLRGGANWIVVSSEISAIFDDLEYFHVSNAAPDQDQYNMGIERVGTLSGRYQVYRDPYFPPNTVLLGHKGSSLLDTGYVYAPYVPLQLTPTMYNPFNFTPIKGIMTRYAKKMVNNRFYGKITVDGVRTFDLRELR
ncbi:hypothetical protein N9H63_01445 [bacterium]|nr:hypothetical protein [bacterium]